MTIVAEPVNTPAAWSERAEREPTSWQAAGWSQRGQISRFAVALAALAPRPFESLLDFGCGTGAFATVLPQDVHYVGFDTAPGMVERAQREHRSRIFQTWEPGNDFDLIACIGTFNLPSGGGKQDTWLTLRRLWDRCSRTMAVSLYAGDDDHCLIYDEHEVQRAVGGLSHLVSVTRWRDNDILAVVTR